MSDYIVHASGANQQVRLYAATTRDLVEEARQIHNTSPICTAALGRLLTAGGMMGCMMKGENDRLTIQIKCSGPIGGLTVTADSRADVKGYVNNPSVILPPNDKGKLNVGGALDLGVLRVIRDMGLKEPYVGDTQLVSGEIAEDLTYYFTVSEQTNSSVGLGVLMNKNNTVKQAGGFIVQLMPFTQEDVIDRLEKNLSQIDSVTSMLDAGMTPEDMLRRIMDGFDIEFYDRIPTQYKCDCSQERVEKAIISIGRKDIQEMIDDGKPIEVGCEFCGKHYTLSTEDLKRLLAEAAR